MSMTFKAGDATIHRIIEMECGFTPALEFLPNLTKEVLDANRSWLHPAALDDQDNLMGSRSAERTFWSIAASATTRTGRCVPYGTRRKTTRS